MHARSEIGTIAQCTAFAKQADAMGGDAPADDEDAADALAEVESYALSDLQKKMVDALFKVWDFNGNGTVELGVLTSTGVSSAPERARAHARA